jgi:hypothetical protein
MQTENGATQVNGIATKAPIKFWTDDEGFAISCVDRKMKEQGSPQKVVRTMDISEADVVYVDSEDKHFRDTHAKAPEMIGEWGKMKPNSMGSWCPYACKIDSKKRTAIMYGFANHLFPGFGTDHPKSWLIPEETQELEKHMTETGAIIICKPNDGYCGAGIFIAQTVEDLKFVEGTKYICQIYINNPLTFGERKRKIDYRFSFVNVDNKGGVGEVYYQTHNQGRVAVDTFQPLSKENKDDVTTHITFYPELFSDPTKYIVTTDVENFSEVCNFQCWEQVCQFYHSHGHPEFEKIMSERITTISKKLQQIMRPFYRMVWAAKGITFTQKLNLTYANFFGSDVLIDEDYKCHVLEFNITPSCGDYLDSHGLEGEVNQVFLKWGKEATELWFEMARNLYDGVPFGGKQRIGSYQKIFGSGLEAEYSEEGDTLDKLFNLFLLFVTGSSKLPEFDAEKMGERMWQEFWFPYTIERDQLVAGFRGLNERVTEAELIQFYEKFSVEENGIYLVACAMCKLFTREESLEMLNSCDE